MMGALSPQKQNLPSWANNGITEGALQNLPSWANNGITEGALQNLPATYQTPSDEFRSGMQGFLDSRQQAQFSPGALQAAQGIYGNEQQKLAATRGSGTSAGVL
jgi:hypothetical protein